jgi:putative inorganic carbon (HCO3(-)) transporter
MTAASLTFERVAAGLLLTSIAVVSFNLLVAQVLFGVAALMCLQLTISEGARPALPRFAWALGAYAGWTVLSALRVALDATDGTANGGIAVDPWTSLIDLKQLVLFLIVPMVMRLLRGNRAMTAINVIIAIGAAAALVAVVQSSIFGFDNLGNRPMGSLSHYMTYSGVIMLVLGAAVARILFYPDQRIWPGVAIPALVAALAMTLTRNAYIGAAAAVLVLLAARNVKLLLLIPAAALLFIVAAPPGEVRNRVTSVTDLQDPSNRDRVQMLQMGADIVADYPVFGVGPEMIGRVYGRYLRPDPVHTYNPHLHNVPMQIAAERGLPALALWLLFVGLAAWDLRVQLRHGPARAIAGAGLAAVVAMLAAGLFEYNFGDSEFLMLFLCLITLPFAARLPIGPTASTTGRVAAPPLA